MENSEFWDLVKEGKALLEAGKNEEAYPIFAKCAEIGLRQGDRLASASMYINAVVCLERAKHWEEAEAYIKKSLDSIFESNPIVEIEAEQCLNNFLSRLTRDKPKLALEILQNPELERGIQNVLCLDQGFRLYYQALELYNKGRPADATAPAVRGALLLFESSKALDIGIEGEREIFQKQLFWAAELMQMAAQTVPCSVDDQNRAAGLQAVFNYLGFYLFKKADCIPCAISCCYDAVTYSRVEKILQEVKGNLLDHCFYRVNGQGKLCPKYIKKICTDLTYIPFQFSEIQPETISLIVSILKQAVQLVEKNLPRYAQFLDAAAIHAWGIYQLTADKSYLEKAALLEERAGKYLIRKGIARIGFFVKAWSSYHRFLLSGNVGDLEDGLKCLSESANSPLLPLSGAEDESIDSLRRFLQGFKVLAKVRTVDTDSQKILLVQEARAIFDTGLVPPKSTIALTSKYCDLLERLLRGDYSQDTLNILNEIQVVIRKPTSTCLVATTRLNAFLDKLKEGMDRVLRLSDTHVDSIQFGQTLEELQNLKVRLLNEMMQVDLFSTSLQATYPYLMPYESVVISKQSEYIGDLKQIIRDALQETEPSYRKFKKLGKELGKAALEEAMERVIEEIAKGAGTSIPLIGIVIDQYFDKRKADGIRKAIIAGLYERKLRDVDTLATIVGREKVWVEKVLDRLKVLEEAKSQAKLKQISSK